MTIDHLDAAKSLLMELLYKSREKSYGNLTSTGGLCGLGDPAAVFKNIGNTLSPALQSVFIGQDVETQRKVTSLVESWLKEQDGLDRERNHFLKKFRHEHGFDRRQYDAETEGQFEKGLQEVNDRQNAVLSRCASELLRILQESKRSANA